jgi:hypothetical protein
MVVASHSTHKIKEWNKKLTKKSTLVKEPGHPLVMHQKAASYAPRLQKLAIKIHQDISTRIKMSYHCESIQVSSKLEKNEYSSNCNIELILVIELLRIKELGG